MPGLVIHQTAGNECLVVVGNFEFVEKYNEKLLNLLKLHATGASLVGEFHFLVDQQDLQSVIYHGGRSCWEMFMSTNWV